MRAVYPRLLSYCALLLSLLAMPQAGAVVFEEPNERNKGTISGEAGNATDRLPDKEPVTEGDHDRALALQLTTGLPVATKRGENERDLLRLMYRTLVGRDIQIDNQLALAEMLLQMERDAALLQASAQKASEKPSAQPVQETTPAAVPAGFDLSELLATEDSRIFAGLGVLLLALIVLTLRRKATPVSDPVPHRAVNGGEEALEPRLSSEASEVDLEQETVLSLEEPPDALQNQMPDRVPYRWQALLSRPSTIPQSRQLNDLAEIILSVGKVQRAEELLRRFIETYPKLALELWIRLLELYREQDKQTEFEILSVTLNRNFNVECVPWEMVQSAEYMEMTLQLLPHIRDRVDSTSGHPECLDYLLRLLLNNRNGERHGFSLAVTKEILILIDLIAAEADGRKVSA